MRVAAKTLALVLAAATPVAAQPSEADVAFKNARDLFKAGKYAEACEQFERSQELDPQLGTQFNLAQCDEKIGKLATALALYKHVAANDTNAERRKFAADLAAKLGPRVPKIVVSIAGDPERLKVELDGKAIAPNVTQSVDMGTYKLVVTADGMREVGAIVRINEESKTTTVVVPLVSESSSEQAKVTQRSELTDERGSAGGSGRRTAGKVVLALGGATLIAGGVFGYLAMKGWDDAKATCDGSMTCMTLEDATKANDLREQAMSRATISNVLFVGGGVLAVTGLVLWLTAPAKQEVQLSASATSSSAGVVLSGSF